MHTGTQRKNVSIKRKFKIIQTLLRLSHPLVKVWPVTEWEMWAGYGKTPPAQSDSVCHGEQASRRGRESLKGAVQNMEEN